MTLRPHHLLAIVFLILIAITTIAADYKLANYGLTEVEGTLAAIGDFNSDKQADLFIVTYDDTTSLYMVKLYLWTSKDDKRYQYKEFANPVTSVDPIYSVILGDFNYDGRLDILITGPKLTADKVTSQNYENPFQVTQTTTSIEDIIARGEYYVHIFFGNASTNLSITPYEVLPRPVGQVSSMSLSGALLPDLFGMSYNETTGDFQRALWSFTPSGTRGSIPADPLTSFELTFTALPSVTGTYNPALNTTAYPYLAKGFAPILGDFDGDCAADLIITSTKIKPDQQQYPGQDLNGATPYDPSVLQFDYEKQIEIWMFDRSADIDSKFPYYLHTTLPAQLGILQPAVGDFNKDGALDLVVPYCYPYATCGDKTRMEIYYNSQKGMCSTISLSSSCRSTTSLCVSDPNWSIDYPGKQIDKAPEPAPFITLADEESDDDEEDVDRPTYYNDYKITTTKPALFDNGEFTFLMPNLNQPLCPLNPPFHLTVMDINLDGDLDLAFIAQKVGVAQGNQQKSMRLQQDGTGATFVTAITTTDCKSGTCSSVQHKAGLYTFGHISLPNLRYITSHSYNTNFGTIDFGNSGSMDMIVIRYEAGYTPPDSINWETDSAGPSTYATMLQKARMMEIQNNFYDDVYFLTLLGGNGMCHSWCNGLEFPSPKPYGVSQSGLVFKFTVTALNGKKSPRIFMQQSQTAYSPLAPPYQIAGLGRTSNYIEELFLGIPSTQAVAKADNSQLFQAMIPNSQIYIFPYPITSPASWRIELFISPTQRLLAVFIAFLVTTTACCLVILALHLREKWAEEKLKKQRQRLFAF